MKTKKPKNKKPKNKSKKEKTKLKLEEERARLLKMVEKYEKPTDFGSDVDHFDEEADEAEELANQIGISEALRERISEIDSALLKLSKSNKKAKTNPKSRKNKNKNA